MKTDTENYVTHAAAAATAEQQPVSPGHFRDSWRLQQCLDVIRSKHKGRLALPMPVHLCKLECILLPQSPAGKGCCSLRGPSMAEQLLHCLAEVTSMADATGLQSQQAGAVSRQSA